MVHKKRLIAEDEEYIVHRNGKRIEVTNKTGDESPPDVPKKKKKLTPDRKENER
ncbi:MAG: hypothetical protein ABID84_03615 [Chloroflexota bacterium]